MNNEQYIQEMYKMLINGEISEETYNEIVESINQANAQDECEI